MRVPQRRSQEVDPVHADEIPVTGSSIEDIDIPYFDSFFEKEFGEPVESQRLSRAQLLENKHLASNGRLNISGTLLFASKPYVRLPDFIVKVVDFPEFGDGRDHSVDIKGKMSDVFRQTVNFLLANVRHVQNNQGFNSLGEPEIPRVVSRVGRQCLDP